MCGVNNISREDLLKLPKRNWEETNFLWDSILLLPTNEEHNSGWGTITIIGCTMDEPVQILTESSDDIEWDIVIDPYGSILKTDCCIASGAFHFWVRRTDKYAFHVSHAISSIKIKIVKV